MDAGQAVSKIDRGSRVFIGTGCGEPQHLIRAMVKDEHLQDIMVYQMLSYTFSEFVDDPSFLRRFSLKLIPGLFSSHRIGLDVALIQVSPPDRFGYCSLGVSVDITRSGMDNASFIIAQVNPRMPRTWGDSFVHVDDIGCLVLHEEPLVEALPRFDDNEVSRRIGMFVSQLVEDGDTLQIGFGHLPFAILQHLDNKADLGIHTQVITDGFLPLFEKGVITNKKKSLLPGRVVTSLCMGSDKLYQYVDNNPIFYFRSSEFVNDPTEIGCVRIRSVIYFIAVSVIRWTLSGEVPCPRADSPSLQYRPPHKTAKCLESFLI